MHWAGSRMNAGLGLPGDREGRPSLPGCRVWVVGFGLSGRSGDSPRDDLLGCRVNRPVRLFDRSTVHAGPAAVSFRILGNLATENRHISCRDALYVAAAPGTSARAASLFL